MPKLSRSTPGVMMEKIGFDNDHVHLVMVIPPKYAIADVIGMLKNKSASLMRQKFEWLRKVFWRESIFWSPGYFVSSVGINRDTEAAGEVVGGVDFLINGLGRSCKLGRGTVSFG
jgi:putative transposase